MGLENDMGDPETWAAGIRRWSMLIFRRYVTPKNAQSSLRDEWWGFLWTTQNVNNPWTVWYYKNSCLSQCLYDKNLPMAQQLRIYIMRCNSPAMLNLWNIVRQNCVATIRRVNSVAVSVAFEVLNILSIHIYIHGDHNNYNSITLYCTINCVAAVFVHCGCEVDKFVELCLWLWWICTRHF